MLSRTPWRYRTELSAYRTFRPSFPNVPYCRSHSKNSSGAAFNCPLGSFGNSPVRPGQIVQAHTLESGGSSRFKAPALLAH
jgi:hypothetical protein